MKETTPLTTGQVDRTRIIERPDGIYWLDGEDIECGPFATLTEAMADRNATLAAEAESLQEAEPDGDLDIADWVDPDTGELAEGAGPHIEDH